MRIMSATAVIFQDKLRGTMEMEKKKCCQSRQHRVILQQVGIFAGRFYWIRDDPHRHSDMGDEDNSQIHPSTHSAMLYSSVYNRHLYGKIHYHNLTSALFSSSI